MENRQAKEQSEGEAGRLDLGVRPQAVELVRGLVVPLPAAAALPEARGNFIKGSALCLGHLEVGEDEEDDQQHREDDEDVGATELLGGREGGEM